jgi:hypothetical protein
MNNKRSKSKLKFKRKSKGSNIQSRHVVGPKDYRKPKYMRDPNADTNTATYYPDRRK